MTTIHTGFVLTESGSILLQLPGDNQWGFILCDDECSWPGGFGIASDWEPIEDDDPRITAGDHEALDYFLDDARVSGVA